MNRILSNCSIQVALKSCLAFRPVHKNQKTFAVYSIPCGDCENASSLKEHQIAVSTFNKGKTEHMLCDIKHTIEWDDSKVITTNNNMAATTSYCNSRSNSMLVRKRWVVNAFNLTELCIRLYITRLAAKLVCMKPLCSPLYQATLAVSSI